MRAPTSRRAALSGRTCHAIRNVTSSSWHKRPRTLGQFPAAADRSTAPMPTAPTSGRTARNDTKDDTEPTSTTDVTLAQWRPSLTLPFQPGVRRQTSPLRPVRPPSRSETRCRHRPPRQLRLSLPLVRPEAASARPRRTVHYTTRYGNVMEYSITLCKIYHLCPTKI